jgi:CRP-like cAMP-binding protein
MASIDLFRNDPNVRPFAAGEAFFEEGAEGHHEMFVVVEGEVDIITHGKTVETVGPGGIFGEMALVDRGVRSAGVVAKTDGKIVPIDEKRFLFLVGNTPFFAIEVMRTLAGRLRHMDDRL